MIDDLSLYNYLSELIPDLLSCDWDNDGLMCFSGTKQVVKRLLITLDVTEKAVQYAVDNGFNVIVSHHPLIFKPFKSLTSLKFFQLVKNDITVMSFHTRLDAIDGGVCDELSHIIGLTNVSRYGPMLRIGELIVNFTFSDFATHLKNVLNAPYINTIKCTDKVRNVAVISGDGKDFFKDAVASGVDTFVTGSMGYHNLTDASDDSEINIFEAGHFYTEYCICSKLKSILFNRFPDLDTYIYNSNSIQTFT